MSRVVRVVRVVPILKEFLFWSRRVLSHPFVQRVQFFLQQLFSVTGVVRVVRVQILFNSSRQLLPVGSRDCDLFSWFEQKVDRPASS